MAAQLKAILYKGDDVPQRMARTMWLPMLLMGAMAVAVGFTASIAAGVKIGDFFGGEAAESLRTGQSVAAWAIATVFLGMAFILSSITMVLVNIIRTLRDTGRDVQQAVGAAQVTQLRKPWTGVFIPHVMMMGLMLVVAAFVIGLIQAAVISDIPADALAEPARLQGQSLADFGTVQAMAQWLGPLRLLGLALIFVSIVLALRTIIRAITFQAQRVYELADERRAAGWSAQRPATSGWQPQSRPYAAR
ncbi:MAG: hypothetical protein KY462_09905 [Actinobacteria bacterium]|nr:hypothetical protein [Actinomycetota bacterium]